MASVYSTMHFELQMNEKHEGSGTASPEPQPEVGQGGHGGTGGAGAQGGRPHREVGVPHDGPREGRGGAWAVLQGNCLQWVIC